MFPFVFFEKNSRPKKIEKNRKDTQNHKYNTYMYFLIVFCFAFIKTKKEKKKKRKKEKKKKKSIVFVFLHIFSEEILDLNKKRKKN